MANKKDLRREEYIRTQNEHGLKIGDFVKVVRRAWTNQFGWNSIWQKGMFEHIGKIYEIEAIQNGDGIMLKGADLWFPHFILQKVDVVVVKDFDADQVEWANLTDDEREELRQRMSGVTPAMRGLTPKRRPQKLDHEYDLFRYGMMGYSQRPDRRGIYEDSNWIERAAERIERFFD